jgi:5-formyltetrahydrofolate cyclo-ligase
MLMPTKNELRQHLRRKRAAIAQQQAQQAAALAAQYLATTLWLRHARHVAAYLDYGSELQTTPLIDWLLANGKRVYVPKIGANQRMRFVQLTRHTALRQNLFGILQPAPSRPARSPRHMDVILLPLLGFDLRGTRLGTGGGYYDRALAFPCVSRKPLLIGYGYAQQNVESIPAEPWDIRLDAVATELGIYHFNR